MLDDLVRPFRRGNPETGSRHRALARRAGSRVCDVARKTGGVRVILPGEKDTVIATLHPPRAGMLRTRKAVSHHA